MEPMIDENEEQDFEEVYQLNRSADDMYFDLIVTELQQIMITSEFQNQVTQFMDKMGDGQVTKQSLKEAFESFSIQIKSYIQKIVRTKVQDFEWVKFGSLLQNRKNKVDEQILDTLMSLDSLQCFQEYVKDYNISLEEIERHKVLTIKANKPVSNKKVKGQNTIFSGQNDNHFGQDLKSLAKKKSTKEKTEEQLMVPDLILTVKPLRKG